MSQARGHGRGKILTLFLKASIFSDHVNLAHVCRRLELEPRKSYFLATFSKRFRASSPHSDHAHAHCPMHKEGSCSSVWAILPLREIEQWPAGGIFRPP